MLHFQKAFRRIPCCVDDDLHGRVAGKQLSCSGLTHGWILKCGYVELLAGPREVLWRSSYHPSKHVRGISRL